MKNEIKRIIDENGAYLTYTTYNQDGNLEVHIPRMKLNVIPEEISRTLKKFAEDLLHDAPEGSDIVDVLHAVSILNREAELVPDLKNSRKK